MNKISLYGGFGFIGGEFARQYPEETIQIKRDEFAPQSDNILYMISTVDNYNVLNNLHVDIDTNLTTLMKVLDICKQDPERYTFNFVSSWFVYGKNYEMPFREDHSVCNPTGFYSITKHCAEQLIVSFCETYKMKYRIFRLANVLGVNDKKISSKKNALQYLIKEIVNNRDISLYYGGEVLRDYIAVEDVAYAMKECIDKAPTNSIINIGSGIPYKFLDIINMAIEYAKSSSKIIHIQPSSFHNVVQVRHSYLDISKVNSYITTPLPKTDISNIVKNLVDFYKKEIQ